MPSLWGARKRDSRGAAAVETALCLCFLVAPLVFATIAYAYMFSFRQTLSQAASEGARAAVGATTLTAQTTAAQDAIKNSLASYGMSCTAPTNNLTCDIHTTTANCPSTRTCLSVSVSYPYRDHSLLPTIPGLGFTLPANLTFTTVVQVN